MRTLSWVRTDSAWNCTLAKCEPRTACTSPVPASRMAARAGQRGGPAAHPPAPGPCAGWPGPGHHSPRDRLAPPGHHHPPRRVRPVRSRRPVHPRPHPPGLPRHQRRRRRVRGTRASGPGRGTVEGDSSGRNPRLWPGHLPLRCRADDLLAARLPPPAYPLGTTR